MERTKMKGTQNRLIVLVAIIAVGIFSASRFVQPAAAQNGGAQPNLLGFGDNFIITGDYAIGGTGLAKSGPGFASGTISIGNGKDTNPGVAGTNSVPQGAQIVEALLYWQTLEIVGGFAGDHGFFRPVFNGGPSTGYPITGTILTNPSGTVYWTGTGCASASPTSKQLVTYRADVRGLLPQDANGNVIANGDYQVTLASQSNGVPLTLGATLVFVYRVLSPTFPLNAVVISNGTPASTSNMIQKMVGFYDAAHNPVSKLTYIVGNGRKNLSESVFLGTTSTPIDPKKPLPSLYQNHGLPPFPGWYGSWDNPTWFFGSANLPSPLNEDDYTATTQVKGAQQGCVTPAAIIYSTTVKNTDGDGLLDSWKLAMPYPGYCDAVSLDAGVCVPGDTTKGWVDLTGAQLGDALNPHPDVFVQLDYMCSSGDNNTCDGRYDFNPLNPAFGPLHLPTQLTVDPACQENVIQKVVDAFADVACLGGSRNKLHQQIHVHVNPVPGNAVAEQTCKDNNPGNLPFCGSTLQAFPNQPGVVGWKGGFAAIKNQLVDASGHPVPCAVASPPPGCAPRFQHGKKDSWHYVLFGDQLGLPNLSFIGGTLAAGGLCPAGTPCVVQSGNMVTVYTTIGHGLKVDANAGNGRVTIADAFTNPNLIGTFLVTSVTCPQNPDTLVVNDCSYLNKAPGPYTFTINIGNSASATYTRNTDPNLSIVSGLPGTGSGFSDLGGQDSLITLANWGADANPKVIAGTFMHELGHSLGLSHGGLYYDNLVKNPLSNDYRPTIEANCKANFPSVMTYHYQRTLIDNFALDYSEEWLPNPPPSLNDTLDENGVPTPFFMFSNFPFNTPPYLNTFWYAPFTGVGDKAKAHCDGTPIRTGEKDMTITTSASTSISWTAPQDVNFDGVIETVTNAAPLTSGLRGHSDWTPTFVGNPPNQVLVSPALDLRQIAATGNLSVAGGSANIGGGSANIGGGSANIGGGSANIGGGSANIGGGSANIGGGSANLGGGSANIGGGNGDLDRRTADAVTLPPSNLTATEGVSPRTITLNWNAPGFGQIVKYKVYRSDAGAPFTLIGTVTGNPPATTVQDNPACNTGGYRYEVTAVIINPDTNAEQESGPSNTVSQSDHTGQLLTGCYTNQSVGSVGLNPVGISDLGPSQRNEQGDKFQITWQLKTDDTGVFVTDKSGPNNQYDLTLAKVVAIGPVASDTSCGTPNAQTSRTTLLANGVAPQAGTAFTFNPALETFNLTWNTTQGFLGNVGQPFPPGCYYLELDLDSKQSVTTAAFPLHIFVSDSGPFVLTTTLPDATVGILYNNQIQETGGSGALMWTASGSLPPGTLPAPAIAVNPGTGVLSGYATTAGNYNFTAMVTDQLGNTGSQPLMLKVHIFVSDTQPLAAPPFTAVTTLPNGVVGSPYTNTVYESGGVTGGASSFAWALANGSNPLPAGLSLGLAPDGVSGLISGTPTMAGTFTFTAMVTDSASNTGTQNLTITVFAPAPAPYGLVSWYPFEGNANDLEKINNGNVVGTPQFVPGELDNGLKPGPQLSGSLITVPDSPTLALTQFTIGAWVRVDALDNVETMQVVWKGDNTAGDLTTPYSLSVLGSANSSFSGTATVVGTPGPGKVLVILTDGSGTHELDLLSTNALSLGTFHYVAVTADGQKVNLYVDGVLDGNSPASESSLTGLPFTNTNPIQIGGVKGGPPPGNNFDGVIDELQIWNRPLTAAEVSGIFNTVGEYQPAARPAGLVSWWPAEGNYSDIISGNNGAPSGGVGFAPGEVGQAFSLDGMTGYINAGSNSALNLGDFTLAAWVAVNPATNTGERRVVSRDDISVVAAAARQGYTLKSSMPFACVDGEPGLAIITGGVVSTVCANAALSAGFHYLAGTRSGTTIMLYVDGVLVGSTAAASNAVISPATPLVMGQVSPSFNGEFFAGLIDEVQIYNRALTFAEIQGIFNAGGAGTAKP